MVNTCGLIMLPLAFTGCARKTLDIEVLNNGKLLSLSKGDNSAPDGRRRRTPQLRPIRASDLLQVSGLQGSCFIMSMKNSFRRCIRVLAGCSVLSLSLVLYGCDGGGGGPSGPQTTPILPISFSGTSIAYDSYTPAVYDYRNADTYIEPLGLQNDGSGNLTNVSAATLGLSSLFAVGRVNRDCRTADFNGDGLPDIVCNTYSPEEAYTTNPALTFPVSTYCTDVVLSYSANSIAMLFFNNGGGTFTEDSAFSAKAIKGFGETIIVADFNNDGFLDLFLPYYSQCSTNEHSYLLINDGVGSFTDISVAAGVDLRNIPLLYRVEGAQALDINNDGWIDFYVGSHFFINNGVSGCTGAAPCSPTFTDQRAALGLPLMFDEGLKFLDWNNDGFIDLVLHHPTTGPALYQYDGTSFAQANIIPSFTYKNSFGMNIYDLNNDGKEDIFLSGGSLNNTVILLNNGTGFQRANSTAMDAWGNDMLAFGDINKDGRIDVLKRWGGNLMSFHNDTAIPDDNFLSIEVVGANDEKNQQGRIVKITPQNHTDIIFTRIMDSGSGFMAQNQYDLLVGTPYPEAHTVKIYYSTGMVQFTMNPGDRKRVHPDGTVVAY